MKIKLTIKTDTLTPDLKRRLRKVKDPTKVLEAAGGIIAYMAEQAFTTPRLRPAAWAPLKSATIKKKAKMGWGPKPLIASGDLQHSPRVIEANKKFARVGTHQQVGSYSLGAIHQLGAPGANIPARPFFPFSASGEATDLAKRRVRAEIERWMDNL